MVFILGHTVWEDLLTTDLDLLHIVWVVDLLTIDLDLLHTVCEGGGGVLFLFFRGG
jgi:hypothetical protein